MRYIVGVFVVLFFFSCDNELDLVADFKEVPVVYGLLDLNDTVQYIRVERAFADRAISANEIAQDPDSLYYDDITVKLLNLNSGLEFTLDRVDGNLIGLERDPGVFAQSPNYLYRINTTSDLMRQGDSIRLQISGVFSDKLVSSTTDIFEEPFFVTPSSLNFERNKKVIINWKPDEDPTVYSASFYFPVTEFNSNGGVEEKLLKWNVLNNSEDIKMEADGEAFFSFLKGALDEDPSITRSLGLAQFELVSGNSILADYIRVGQANLGITSSGEIPIFSNISDGLGLFGSKYVDLRTDIPYRQVTIDSLKDGSITKALNFQ